MREQARNQLREQKFEDAYNDWAKDLRARAYIEMREPRCDARVRPHQPRKRFGQHFLADRRRRRHRRRHRPRPGDALVEIGPGLGALTQPLLGRVPRSRWSNSTATSPRGCATRRWR